MKKLVLFLFSLWNIMGLQTHAQVQQDTFPWCPPGARWVYLCNGVLNTNEYLLHSYVNDTFIQNRSYKVIECTRFWQYAQFPNSPLFLDTVYYEYLREQNDTIYHFYEGIDKILYIMNANIGISWEVYPYKMQMCDTTDTTLIDTVHITNVGLDTIQNWELQFFQVNHWNHWWSPYSPNWHLGGKIIKNIGSYHNFFPLPGYANCNSRVDGGHWIPIELACYQDFERGFIPFRYGQCKPCWDLSSVPKISLTNTQSIYFEVMPNPIHSQDILKVIPKNKEIQKFRVEIWDLQGKKYVETESNYPSLELSIKDWNSGIYIVKIKSEKGIEIKKIIKL